MKQLLRFSFLAITAATLFVSCEEDDPVVVNLGKYEKGKIILNEGNWNNSNASVSFLNDSTDAIEDNIFTIVNSRPLGDVLQSACKSNGKVFLVLNSSNKVEVVRSSNFREVGVINGLTSPRYMAICNGKGYITQWTDKGSVAVVDTSNLQVTSTIEVGSGPEGIIVANNLIWVANCGKYYKDSTVSVIDPATREVVKTIQLGAYNPQQLVADRNGNVWVICSGYVDWYSTPMVQTPSKLIRISATSKEVAKSYTISETDHPMRIDINSEGQTVYFGGGFGFVGIYAVGITASTLPSTPVVNNNFYGFNIDPATNEMYCLEAPSFTASGKLKRYTSAGQLVKEYTVGINPNGVIF